MSFQEINEYIQNHKLFVGSIVIICIFLIVVLLFSSGGTIQDVLRNQPNVPIQFERGGAPDRVQKTLPDGSRVEYGTLDGPLDPRTIEDMERILEEKKKKSWNFFAPEVFAAAIDDLTIRNPDGVPQALVDSVRSLFRDNIIHWTEDDLKNLAAITLLNDINSYQLQGALGTWTYGKNNAPPPDNTFLGITGFIYLYAGPRDVSVEPVEFVASHEYGHHFVEYWSYMRNNGEEFTAFPLDEAGDFYQLRPLPDACQCNDGQCEDWCTYTNDPTCMRKYLLNPHEIIAEDYRILVTTRYTTNHNSLNILCKDNAQRIQLPLTPGTSNYIRSLPIPTPSPTLAPSPTGTPLIPQSGLYPTINEMFLPPCSVVEDDSSNASSGLKLKIGPPCRGKPYPT